MTNIDNNGGDKWGGGGCWIILIEQLYADIQHVCESLRIIGSYYKEYNTHIWRYACPHHSDQYEGLIFWKGRG